MKNLSTTWYKSLALTAALLCGGVHQQADAQIFSTLFQNDKTHTATPTGRDEALDELTLRQMLHSVDLGKQSEFIQRWQTKEGTTRLYNGKYNPKSGCTVENYRNKEVLLITIPAELLFGPNEIDLKPGAAEYLNPIKRYLREPDMYRVLLVMHTDNSGSELYRDEITGDRVDAVFNWFEASDADTRYLFPYAMSDDLPLYPNDSYANRARNRRLEIYLMPGQKMLEQAKKGKITF